MSSNGPTFSQSYLDENIAYRLIVTVVIWTVLSFLSVVGRIVVRRKKGVAFGWDDYLVFVAEFFGLALAICTLLLTRYGVGRHLPYVLQTNPGNLITVGKISFALEIAYIPTMTFAKLSVLALYRRIFNVAPRWFTTICWIMIVYVILWMVALFLTIFLECQPLHTLWGSPTCTPSSTTTNSTNILSVLADVIIFALPQPIIWKLQMTFQRRLAVSSLLLLGLFATVVSIVRIPLIDNTGFADILWSLVTIDTLTVVEPLTIIICACLPVTQALSSWIMESHLGLSFKSLIKRSRSKLSESDASDAWNVESAGGQWISIDSSKRSGSQN